MQGFVPEDRLIVTTVTTVAEVGSSRCNLGRSFNFCKNAKAWGQCHLELRPRLWGVSYLLYRFEKYRFTGPVGPFRYQRTESRIFGRRYELLFDLKG